MFQDIKVFNSERLKERVHQKSSSQMNYNKPIVSVLSYHNGCNIRATHNPPNPPPPPPPPPKKTVFRFLTQGGFFVKVFNQEIARLYFIDDSHILCNVTSSVRKANPHQF